MKVKIGKYLDWWGPYQLAELLRYVGVSDDRCYEIGRWLDGDHKSWLARTCEWIHAKRKRTVSVKIDRYDTWSMDSTLAIIILPMLKQLRETKQGSPCRMPAFSQTSNSAQHCFEFYEAGDEEAWSEGHRQWMKILDEMIWTFEQLQPDYDWEEQYWAVKPEMDLVNYPEDEGKTSIPLRWKTEGVADYEGMKKHGDRIQAGLELFGKYYSDLWD